MSYFVIELLLWLSLGAPKISLDFNPWMIAFLIAILIDLYLNKPWNLLHKA